MSLFEPEAAPDVSPLGVSQSSLSARRTEDQRERSYLTDRHASSLDIPPLLDTETHWTKIKFLNIMTV